MKTKDFNIETILSVTHGKLLTDMSCIYEILNFICDDNLFTHQIPRACKYARKIILKQHPQLNQWNQFSKEINTENWRSYKEKAIKMFGEKLQIQQNASDWTKINPIQELANRFALKSKNS